MHSLRFTALLLFGASLTFAGNPTEQVKALDPSNMDMSVPPCQDFYQYANGGWLKNNPVPPAYSSWGSFNELAEKNNEVLHAILDEAASKTDAPEGSNLQKVGDFYASGMDSARAEAEGIAPLQADFDMIKNITTVERLQDAITHFQRFGMDVLFSFSSQQDFKNSDMMIAQGYQGGITLPDRDYYVNDNEESRHIRTEFLSYATTMFTMLGDDSVRAAGEAETVLAMETRLARSSMTRLEQRNPDSIYHVMTVEELGALAPGFAWKRYLHDLDLENVNAVNISQPDFFKQVGIMMRDVPLDDWNVYLRWHVVDEAAPYLGSAFVNEHFSFHGTVLGGAKELQPRWKRVMRTTNGLLGDALGRLYVDKTFSPEAKARAKEMVANLEAAFRERLHGLQWMSEKTKEEAGKKLTAFVEKIGFPDKWKDYKGLEIDRGPYVLNVKRGSRFAFSRDIEKIGKPVDRTEWHMTPPTVNAYYNPSMNEIVFPAGILQPPFFNPDADDAVNYGGMGAVIGHEMTHGFDDQGRKFDPKGNLNDWWTEEDGEKFVARAAVLQEQFDSYVVLDSLHVNGKLTLGENIADLGGLSIAYAALQKALKGKPGPAIDGFSPEQRFFLAWAQIWRRNYRPEDLKRRLVLDPHSPSMFRTNGPLSDMPEFYQAFSCKSGDAMYRPENDRAKIW